MSSTLTILKDEKNTFTNSSQGTSKEQGIIIHEAKKAIAHVRMTRLSMSSVSYHLFSSSNISEFEDRVEEIYNQLLEGRTLFSDRDISFLEAIIDRLTISQLLALARLFGPFLEKNRYSQKASSMIKKLLRHSCPEARYAALEAISFALGEVSIAESMLEEAKDILKNETSSFVLDYLESL
ncbi:hypothetical protein [Synechocystis sp. PCC 7509]|uniref:hypothetical protein n=1 Tax=Synechocystis sp. PCC 7509 TaxID=927677 RepID=UPI0002ABB2AA|nr:hypothetical protein [Synechocystis sp. PCC 7509]